MLNNNIENLINEAANYNNNVTGHFVGISESIKKMMVKIGYYVNSTKSFSFDKVKKPPPPLLLEGESGTGKTLLAKEIYALLQEKRNGPFQEIMGANLQPNLVQQTLFGAKKGSHSTAHADSEGIFYLSNNGVLFIDEIADVPLDSQAHLLKPIEEGFCYPVGGNKNKGPLDVLVIAATNKDLSNPKTFRQDLNSRFVVRIKIPPLNDRKEDIPILVQYFLDDFTNTYNGEKFNIKYNFTSDAIRVFIMECEWFANVRSLKHFVSYLCTIYLHNNSMYIITDNDIRNASEDSQHVTLVKPNSLSKIQDGNLSEKNKSRQVHYPETYSEWAILFQLFQPINWADLAMKTGLNKSTLISRYKTLEDNNKPELPFQLGERRRRISKKIIFY